MAESFHFSICHALAEPLRGHLYQAPLTKHLLASAIVFGFDVYRWDGFLAGAVSGWPVFQSLLYTLSLHFLLIGIFWVNIFEMGEWPITGVYV